MVSIIVPVFNAEKTLRACVDSVLAQTYTNYELILIDDGSNDRSGQICDQIMENCMKNGIRCQVIHQENGGVSKARNCGIDHANGEYLVCVDSDDEIEPCYLMDLVRTTEEHPEFGHVLCGFRCTSNTHNYILSDEEALTVVTRREYMRLYGEVLIQGPCLALYKTEVVQRNRICMREDLSLAEDLFFNLEYLDALGDVNIGVVNSTNYVYHNEGSTSLFRRYRPDLLEIHEQIIERIKLYLIKWGVEDPKEWKKYYSAVLSKYISVLDNTFSELNPQSKRLKIKYNNMVMRKSLYREALKKSKVKMIPSFKFAYSSGNYRMVLLAKRIETIKIKAHELTGKLRRA